MSSNEVRFADGSLRYNRDKDPLRINVNVINPIAEPPSRENNTDPYYEIYAISRQSETPEDKVDENNYFDTGLIINPQQGCICFIVEEDSLQQFGYRLSSGVIVIPPGNDRELKIPLYKFRDTEDDLELPHKVAKLVPVPISPSLIFNEVKKAPIQSSFNPFMTMSGPGQYQFNDPTTTGPGSMDAYNRQVAKMGKGTKRPVSAPRAGKW